MIDKTFDIVVVGELNADLILSGDVTPEYGQVEKLIDDASLVMGGSSAIFACGAARLGLRVGFIGIVGADTLGRFVIEQLDSRGVDTRGVRVDPRIKTGLTVMLSRKTDRAMLTYSGSIGALTLADVNFDLLAQARHVHMGSFYMLDALRPNAPSLFSKARAMGLTASIDTNYDPSEQWQGGIRDTLAQVDVFLPNETELTHIARRDRVDEALAELRRAVPLTVVKLGKDGALASRANGETARAESILVNVVDTTGAGDSFDAGFIYGYLAGWDLPRALRMGCICGALSTRAAGGTAAQATLEEAMGSF